MVDRITPEQRSWVMSRIRSRNTRPEMVVRRYLWQNGYHYRLCVKTLPGRPDIVINRLKVAIFVNGCFWHGHKTHKEHIPKTNTGFWQAKINNNRRRDIENGIRLRNLGYTVITIWECELTPKRRAETLGRLHETLRMLASTPYTRTTDEDVCIAAEPQYTYGTTDI